ncbi:hypothetical protein [Antrihabitans sp. YC2-6]|uniref:hypothetical protein n=1 Tax=Antrihabitans sp. YC2-6 TaxID=2799498 RepID=UPI0018F34D07|nr:hypothetical protein [Antrihabitans sp. YC2-6]MBJ8346990.1 hypothetical protein [Antrihabitans sp. YC2-6]
MTIEVRVFKGDDLLHSALCESESDAETEVERWADYDDVTCEVAELALRPWDEDLADRAPAEPADDEYAGESSRHWPC